MGPALARSGQLSVISSDGDNLDIAWQNAPA